MSDPFRIEGPALISFSGGRTSGLMLRRVLDAYGGALPADVHACFANTGKERPETLDFVRDVAERWSVRVRWVEGPAFREVDYHSAARDGAPFAALIAQRHLLPNPVARFCTAELKVRPMRDFMRACGYEHWTNLVGIRADEPRRVARHQDRETRERWVTELPLARAGITVSDVRAFWAAQPFDLHLRPWEGNCDLCFLKGKSKRLRIMRDRPDLAAWWIEQEASIHSTKHDGTLLFRADVPSYAHLLRVVQRTPMLFPDEPACDLSDLGDCECDLEPA